MMKFYYYSIIALLLFSIGCVVGYNFVEKDTVVVKDTDTLYVTKTNVSTITLKGRTVFVPYPVSSVDTLFIKDSLSFYTEFDTVFTGDHCKDSVYVSYHFPENMFKVRNTLSNERLYITKYIESPKKEIAHLCLNFDLTGNHNGYGSAIGMSALYKQYMLGLVVNTHKEAGLRFGYLLR